MKHVAVVDTPSIKQFVFGADSLIDIRGASALLDRLNRAELPRWLSDDSQAYGGTVETVFAAGGAGQFIFDGLTDAQVEEILDAAAARFAAESDNQLRLVYGIAPWGSAGYTAAVRRAFGMLQRRREWGLPSRAVQTAPFLRECDSLGHLPACFRDSDRDEWVSAAARWKRREGEKVRASGGGAGPLATWRQWVAGRGDEAAEAGIPGDFQEIGERLDARGYIAVVYCDGNNMGRLVQELPSPGVARAFSEIVDSAVRAAACESLYTEVYSKAKRKKQLPFDILLLGGDDLVVAVPATAGLSFAIRALEVFEAETRRRIQAADQDVREFFLRRLGDGALSLSAGVAIARASYPFYLTLELAEDLLKSAKKGATQERLEKGEAYVTASYLDFQSIEGGATARLADLRAVDYCVYDTEGFAGPATEIAQRTCRPYSLAGLQLLVAEAKKLASIPSSKRHSLWEAALEPRPLDAEIKMQELLGRLGTRTRGAPSQQVNWWLALERLTPPGWVFEYPWYVRTDGDQVKHRKTAAADLLEVLDFLPK